MSGNLKKRDKCEKCVARLQSAFRSLRAGDLDTIDRLRMLTEFNGGAHLPLKRRGEEGFFCIRKGHIKIKFENGQREGVVRICGPGDLAGYNNGVNRISLESLEEGAACFFPLKEFQAEQAKSANIANGIVDSLCRILNIKDQRISDLENLSVKSRVASLLIGLASKFGISSKFGYTINAKVDRNTLAKLAGTGVESLARALTSLESSGAIFRERRSLHIVNLAKLKKIAKK